MSNPAESERNGKPEVLAPDDVKRLAELEGEVARLRSENEKLNLRILVDSDIREAYFLQGLPRSQEEYQEMVANARPFRDVLEELEKKHGLDEHS